MVDYKKRNCEDMKLFVFEWVIQNPEAGKGIKYIRNLNKAELIKACLFIEGKLSKDVLMEEVIIPKKLYFSKTSKQRYLKKKGMDNNEDDDDKENDDVDKNYKEDNNEEDNNEEDE
jgi:hypothetical protein